MAYTEFFCDPVSGSNSNGGSSTGAPTFTDASGSWDGTSVITTSQSTANVVVNSSFVNVNNGAYVALCTAKTATTLTLSTTKKAGTAPGAGSYNCVADGPWLGPTGATAFPFGFIAGTLTDTSGDYPRVNLKNSATYSVTAAMTHANAGPIYFQGMTSTPGDGGRATISGGSTGASYTVLTVSAQLNYFRDLVFSGNGATGSADGIFSSPASGQWTFWERCSFTAMRGCGLNHNQNLEAIECEFYANNASNTANLGGFRNNGTTCVLVRCIAHHNTGSLNAGFALNGSIHALFGCVADSNGSHGANLVNNSALWVFSAFTACANGGSGIAGGGTSSKVWAEDCILANNGAWGVSAASTWAMGRLSNCAYWSNTSGQVNGTVDQTGAITCSAQPLNAPTQGDYTPVAGTGVRGAGRGNFTQNLASWTSGTGSTSYPDVGAVQHQDAGGVSGPPPYPGVFIGNPIPPY